MRRDVGRICCLFGLLAAGVLSGSAWGFQPGYDAAPDGVGNGQYEALCAPACASSPGYNLTPGCCQCQPHCCDNAWEGYCQNKARWQSFWQLVGTGAFKCRRCAPAAFSTACPAGCSRQQVEPMPQFQPGAAVPGRPPPPAAPTPPIHEPTTQKTTWRWGSFWHP